jgi:hypothetical protein
MKVSLSPEARKKIQEAKKRLADAFEYLTKKLNNSGQLKSKPPGLDLSSSGLLKSEQSIQAFKQFTSSSMSGTLNFGTALLLKDYMINFQFVTDPQLKTAAASMGGYFNILAQGVIQQERLKQNYRVMAAQSIINIGQNLLFTFAGRGALLPAAAIRSLAMRLLGRSLATKLIASAGLAKVTFGVSLVIGLVLVGIELFKFFVESEQLKRATEIANKSALVQMFNPQPLMQIYQNNAFLLGTEIQKRGTQGSGMEMLVGEEFEDRLAGVENNEPYSLLSRVYEAAFTGSYARNLSGFDVRGFGFDTAKVLSVASNLERSTQTGYNEDVIANILTISGIYTGGDTSEMQRIMQNIIRANAFTANDVNEATEKFSEFFAAIVGDGKPQAAHLKLLSSLSLFSTQYAMGIRGNLSGTSEIAKIQQFMADNGAINERFDISPLKTAVQTIDNLLLQGAAYQNLGAVQVFNAMGITREAAIRGVTSDATTFEKFISGLFQYLNVGREDVLSENSPVFGTALQNFARQTNLNSVSLNAVVVAMRRYASGHRIEDIRSEYRDNIAEDMNSKLLNAKGGLAGAENFFNMLTNITYSANKLISTVEKNIDVIKIVQAMNSDIVLRGFGNFADAFVSIFKTVLGVQEVVTGNTTRRDIVQNRQQARSGTAAETQGAPTPQTSVGTGNTTRRDIVQNRQQARSGTAAETQGAPTPQTSVGTGTSDTDSVPMTLPEESPTDGAPIEPQRQSRILEGILGIFGIAHAAPLVVTYDDDADEVPTSTTLGLQPTTGVLREETPQGDTEIERQIRNVHFGSLSTTLSLFDGYEASGDYKESEVYQKIHSRLGEKGKENFSPAFFDKAKEVAERLGIPVEYLLTVIHFETMGTFSSTIRPKRRDGSLISSAIGLIQFLSATAEGLGTTTELLSQMTPVQQLEYVEKYFKQHKNKIKRGMSLEDVYLIVFTPTAAGKPADYVLYQRGDAGYSANAGLDLNKDGKITKWEITSKIRERYSRLFNQNKAVGGMVFPASAGITDGKFGVKQTNMHISIPLFSFNPHLSADKFVSYMNSYLNS